MSQKIALIPARSGSKRLKNKNVKLLGGKPLICWTIEAALKAKCVSRVIVSTDCEIIRDIALSAGAEVPCMRPKYLAEDDTTTSDVVMHMSSVLNLKNEDIVFILQPTSPLRTAQNIDDALALMDYKDADGIVSVSKSKHHPLWTNILPEDGNLENFLKPGILNKRSQDLPNYFSLNGAIYAYKVSALNKNKGIFYSNKVFAFVMSENTSVDIDDKYDFYVAEALLRND